MNSKKSVAIDGPSGAGKSTIARRVSEEFGFIYLPYGRPRRGSSEAGPEG